MRQSAPGWYQDHDDPQLARWWDGDRWTEHTLVLDEQDWSTEPDPPARADTRFPAPGFDDTAMEVDSATGFEEDIYAPIQDPWADADIDDAPSETDHDDLWASGAALAGAGAATAAIPTPAWDDSAQAGEAWDDTAHPAEWTTRDPRRRTVADLPRWARIAIPLGVLLLVLLVMALAGALGSSDDDTTTTSSSSTSEPVPSLPDAARRALLAAGSGPFTLSTFTELIPLACDAAANDAPDELTDRIILLGYDAATVSRLMDGLDAGTAEYCPEDMAESPTMLSTIEAAAIAGATTTTSAAVTVPDGPTTTKRPTTTTTRRPTTTTTKAPGTTSSTTTTAAPTTPTEAPPTTQSVPPSTTPSVP